MNILPILFSIWIFAPKQGFCNEGPDQTRRLNVLNTTQYAKCLHDNETVSVEEMEMVSKMLVESCQHLGIQLIRTLSRYESKSDSKGLIFSPSSLWSTLMVTYLGNKTFCDFCLFYNESSLFRLKGGNRKGTSKETETQQHFKDLRGDGIQRNSNVAKA